MGMGTAMAMGTATGRATATGTGRIDLGVFGDRKTRKGAVVRVLPSQSSR
jgi:hypothetical protein